MLENCGSGTIWVGFVTCIWKGAYNEKQTFKLKYGCFSFTQAFAKSSTLASSGVKENVFPNNVMLLLWKIILNNIVIITHDDVGELFC